MKKIIYLLIISLSVLTACEKDPDLSQLSSDFVVSTAFDTNANFSTFSTYYIPDSILIIDRNDEPEYWTANNAGNVTQAIVDQLNNAGYSRVTNKADADLGLQTSLVLNTHFFVNYFDTPYWWWGFPGYWSPGYWGFWGSWRYPYRTTFSFSVGSLLVEMANLKEARAANDDTLSVVWTSYMTGIMSNSDNINTQRASRAVTQAFEQSPYIGK